MGVYIKGMEMPTKGMCKTITIFDDGVVVKGNESEKLGRAIPVPPHGRLMDADSKTFPTPHRNPTNDYMKGWNTCLRSVQQQPTIIPAEEGET